MGIIGRPSYPLKFGSTIQAAPAASTTYYIGGALTTPTTSASAVTRIYIPFFSTIKYVQLMMLCVTPGTSETGTISLHLNATTDFAISTSVTWSQTILAVFNDGYLNPLMTDEVGPTDYVEIKIETPAWVTPPLNVLYWGNINLAGDL